jgi:hypothetical protein
MENIVEPTYDFDFSKLHLGSPISTSGGSYFTKILINNKSLYVQTPKSLTKQGFIKSGKKIYTDLMFSNVDNIFIDWLERLQNKCEELLYDKNETWFETKMEKDDIENAFTCPVKIFKSGKNYLVRINVKNNLKIYDEDNNLFDLETITNDKSIISIIEIQGIKFTSKNFQLEMELKQCMIVSLDPFLDKCFIKTGNKNNIQTKSIVENLSINENKIDENKIDENKIDENKIDENKIDENKINLDDIFNTSISEIENKIKESENLKFKNNIIKEEVKEIDKKELKENNKKELKEIDKKEHKENNKKEHKENNKKEHKENNKKELKENNEEELKKQLPNIEQDSESIKLDIEDLTPIIETKNINEMDEVNIDFNNGNLNSDIMQLKNRNQVYREIYQKAKEKAMELKKATIVAYLELKNIKNMYMLDDIVESDTDLGELDMLESDTEPIFSDDEN